MSVKTSSARTCVHPSRPPLSPSHAVPSRVLDPMTNPLRSLAARITLLVFVATVISSLTASWISMQSLDGFLRQKVGQRFPQLAASVANELDQWYSLRAREIEVFASSAILTESAPRLETEGRRGEQARNEAEQYLRYVLESFPQFERLAIATPEGVPLVELGKARDGIEAEPLPDGFFADKFGPDEHTRISDAYRFGGRLVQIASVPIRNAEARTTARLFAVLDFDGITPILQSASLGGSTKIYLVDRSSSFLNPPPGVAPDVTFQGDGVEREHASVAYYEDSLGQQVIGTSKPFPRFEWTLVIEQHYEEAFAPIMRAMSRVAWFNLAMVLAVGLIAFRIAGSIVRPLGALSDAAKRLSAGERGVEIDTAETSADEVRLLTETFNDISRGLGRNARELEDNRREIESANQELVAKNTELSNVNLVLEQLSITDGLTKLHNHRYFQEAIAGECKRASRTKDPLCLILIDIDFFKKWNDRLGHAGGDETLRRIAEVLNQSCRETDLLARYGGEEFALLAINTDLEGAAALGEKVRQAVEETNFVTDIPNEREPLTVSIGVAFFAGDRRQLFADADSALYAAKDGGRNQVIVAEPDMDVSPIQPD